MSSEDLCQVCSKGERKYNCPRCSIAYCSVDCYKAPTHIQCSEQFFKQCVQEEMTLQSKMRSTSGPSDDVKKMYEILKRIETDQPFDDDLELSDDEELDSDDDDDEDLAQDDDLSKRLEGIDLNDADAIWSQLTDEERQEFNKIIQSEDVTSILPKFNAWWEQKIKRKLITEVNGDEQDDIEPKIEHPPILESIVDFARISTKPPAPCVLNNLINVLAGYASMVRFFYGEHETSKQEALNYLMAVCANLRSNANFDDSAVAIESIRQDAHNEGYSIDEHDMRQMKKDVDCLMEGPIKDKITNTYALAALSELHRLFTTIKAEMKQSKSGATVEPGSETEKSDDAAAEGTTKTSEDASKFSQRFGNHKTNECKHLEKGKITPTIKKIEYYMAFVKKYQ